MRAYLLDDFKVEIDPRASEIGGCWEGKPRNGIPNAWGMNELRFFYKQTLEYESPVIMDIGANTGAFSMLAVMNPVMRSYAFEPAPVTFEVLKQNIILNNLQDRVKAFQLALADKNGRAILKYPKSGTNSGLACIGKPLRFNEWVEYEVDVQRLDDFATEYGIDKVDLLKIDTEGCELFVLRGAEEFIRQCRPNIFCEYYEDNARQFGYHPIEIVKFLTLFGYSYVKVSHEDMYFYQPKRAVLTKRHIATSELRASDPALRKEPFRTADEEQAIEIDANNDINKSQLPCASNQIKDYCSLDPVSGKIILPAEVTRVWIDVGAYDGEVTLPYLRQANDLIVVAFEPLIEKWRQLKKSHPRMIALPMAVSTTQGFADFYHTENDVSSSLHPFNLDGFALWKNTDGLKVIDRRTVPTMPLEQILKRLPLERVEFVKIDAQGHDLDVVKSAGNQLQKIDRIKLEVAVTSSQLYRGSATKKEVVSYMTRLGFKLTETESQTNGQEENLTFLNVQNNSKAFTFSLSGKPKSDFTRGQEMSNSYDGKPMLSIVAAGRNDDHGGNLLRRMQMFINGILAQSQQYRLSVELVLVEWNPPQDRPRLAEVLPFPERSDYCTIRIIQVPAEVHNRYKHADGLALYQMIAKNVGIRRAQGEFILATNIDILFSDELFAFFASGKMTRGKMYRVDRYDVNNKVLQQPTVSEQLAFCRENIIRINKRNGTQNLITGDYHMIYPPEGEDVPRLRTKRAHLHTNGCGDFQLMHRDHWFALHGYPEFDMHSFHVDSLFSFMAHYGGAEEEVLNYPMCIYHIEHSAGWTPEIHKKGTLWKNLEARKVERISNTQFDAYAVTMTEQRKPIIFNDDNWGLETEEFEEDVPVRAEFDVSNSKSTRQIVSVTESSGDPGGPANRAVNEKYLSIVVASRNDDYDANILRRMQVFAKGLVEQCRRFNLDAELIIVEWNPPAGRKRLYEVLDWPDDLGPLTVRFIEVPAEIHNSIGNSDKFPLFQMIAKNVGIRRARGKFVLATNIDILFSNELMQFLSSGRLDENCFYRIDRHDVGSKIVPERKDINEQLEFCRNNIVRVHGLYGTKKISEMESDHFIYDGKDKKLHTNGCGDFTLMSRTNWHLFRAYPELPRWSIYVDVLLLHMAYVSGLHQVILPEPMRIYHIEHDMSWAVSDEAKQKLTTERYPSLDYQKEYLVWCQQMLERGRPITNNDENWGYAQTEFKEYVISGRWKDQMTDRNVISQDNNRKPFQEWIDTLALTQNRLYYRDQTPESLNMLVELVHRYKPTKIVELGTLSGFSLRAWLSAQSEAEVIAIDLSFKPLFRSQKVLPVELSGVRLLEQDILKTDFRQLWSEEDKVLLYIDAHDQLNTSIMTHILDNALPLLPQGSIVTVDDFWYCPEVLTNDSVSRFFEEVTINAIDPLQCFKGYYASYWKGGFFVGFREVVPLVEWVNCNKVELILNPGDKAVTFECPALRKNTGKSFDAERFRTLTGGILYNPVDIFSVHGSKEAKGNRGVDALCEAGAQFYASGRIKEAEDCFGQAIFLDPDINGAFYAQAVCFAREGNFEMATEKLRMEMNSKFPHPRAKKLYEDIKQYIRKKHKPISKVQQTVPTGNITIFALPKAFRGQDSVRQRNAIKSWMLLEPRPEIILFGDDDGVAHVAEEFGLRHIPDVKRNSYGTPLINDLFEKAQTEASNHVLVYVNSDIILLSDFMPAVQKVTNRFNEFLMIEQRWDTDIPGPIDFEDADWEQKLRQFVSQNGSLHAVTGIDCFVFTKYLWSVIRPFGLGRTMWDIWLVRKALQDKKDIIDATETVMIVHQNHPYISFPKRKEEELINYQLGDNNTSSGFVSDAGWKLTPKGLIKKYLQQTNDPGPEAIQLCQKAPGKLRQYEPFEALKIFNEAQHKAQAEKLAIQGFQTTGTACLLKSGRPDEAASAAEAELSLQPDNKNGQKIFEPINRMPKKPEKPEPTEPNNCINRPYSLAITWEQVKQMPIIRLYAGDVPKQKEYEGVIGLSLSRNDQNHLRHDITQPFPLMDNSVDSFQAEDVLEHIPYEKLVPVIKEIYRVLKPDGLFRLSVPDYGCDVLQNRSIKDEKDQIVFDPGGGGTPEYPGHVWFPRIDTVMQLLTKTKFHGSGKIELLHYYNKDGTFVAKPIDYSKGHIMRTPDFDERVKVPYRPMSLVIDLTKGREIASQSCRTKPEIWSGSVLANEINSSPTWRPEKQNQCIQRRFTENSLASFAEELVKKAVQLLKENQESDAMDYFDVGARLHPKLAQEQCRRVVNLLDQSTLARICSKARRKTATVQKHQGASLLLKNTKDRLDKMQEDINGCIENRQSKTQHQYTANKYTCENPERNESRTKKYLSEILRQNRSNICSKMQVLGTKYGGWAVDLDLIPFGSTVISAGVGEDISFDLELINRKNCKIIGIDPTEKAKRYIERNKNEHFWFIHKALYSKSNKKIKIYKNTNPDYVSESITPSHKSVSETDFYEAETISLEDLLNKYKNVSVLKMDIEGAEYEVLSSISKLDIPQICVEFHHFCTDFTANDTEKCIKRLQRMGYILAHCTNEHGAVKEATLVHQKYISKKTAEMNIGEPRTLFTKDVPVILVCYNRPKHTLEVLNALREHNVQNLYVFSDAPKSDEDVEAVSLTRHLVHSIDWTKPKIIERTENLGLARNIVSAVDYVFERHNRLILLEDDCVPQRYFFDFMHTCLEKYENNQRVFGISGYTVQIPDKIRSDYPFDLYFCPRIGSWGWATWKRAWTHYKEDMYELVETAIKNDVDIDQGGTDIPISIENFLKGQLKDVWTLNWVLSVYVNNGIYIYPTRSHISNIGTDGTGAHCGKTDKYHSFSCDTRPTRYPADVFLDEQVMENFKSYYRVAPDRSRSAVHFLRSLGPKKSLKIAQISTIDKKGGAAKVAWMLKEGLKARGLGTQMFVGQKLSNDPDIKIITDPIQDSNTYYKEQGFLSYDINSTFTLSSQKELLESDVAHFHNLHGNYFNPFALSVLTNIKPSVWTLHDMQSMTGHCAYAFDCEKWQTGCGNCPDLESYPPITKDRTAEMWRDKKIIYKESDFELIVPSQWLKNIVKKSILKDKKVHLIYNGIDERIYRPLDKQAIRKMFKIPPNAIIISFVAHGGLIDKRKGGNFILEAYKYFTAKYPNTFFICVGGTSDKAPTERLLQIPFLFDEEKLVQLYCASDIFLFPTLADNCPLVILEVMGCGVPIISFNTGGVPELIEHGKTGLLAGFKNSEEFIKMTECLVADKAKREEFSAASRERLIKMFTLDQMVDRHITLYERLAENAQKKDYVPLKNRVALPTIFRENRNEQLKKRQMPPLNQTVKVAAQHKPNSIDTDKSQQFPIVFVNFGNQDSLKYALAQAKLSNPNSVIYLIGDETNDKYDFVEHHHYKNYSTAAQDFVNVYKHLSTNKYNAELICFLRWFILREFLEHMSFRRCLYLDSDVMLYTDIQQYQRKFKDFDFTLSQGQGPSCNFINSISALTEFCDLALQHYTNTELLKNLEDSFNARVAKGLPGGVCDMTMFGKYREKHPDKVCEISQIKDHSKFDHHLNVSENFEMQNGFKKVIWIKKQPYGKHIDYEQPIKFNTLHFQGKASGSIKDYFTGRLLLATNTDKWIIENFTESPIPPSGKSEIEQSKPKLIFPENRYHVSAIVSTYNSEKFIRGCLEDLEQQTIADKLEIIVVNSGSQENEEAIVHEYQQKYNNIVYIKTGQREGIYTAWNRAIKIARGTFLTNANTDDRHREDALEIMAETLLANPDVALVYGDQICTDTPNSTFANHHAIEMARRAEYSHERLLFGCCVGSQPMWRKSLHTELGYFDDTLTCAGDWDFWLRISISSRYKFKHIPEFLGLYYYNENGIEHGRKIHSLYERYIVGKRYGNPYISVIPLYTSKDNPLVSVIMTVYNCAEYIGDAIESVLIQNYPKFELIIINDGSTDSTKEVISRYEDQRIRYCYQENAGMSNALNHAVRQARGQYIMPLDADDMMFPNFIAKHLAEFEKHPDADLVYCDVLLIDENSKPIRIMNKPEYQDRRYLIRDLFRAGHPVVPFRLGIKRTVYDKIGLYDEKLKVGMDYDMMRRFVKAGLKEHHLSEPLHLRRMHANSLSGNYSVQKAKSHFEVIKRFIDTFTHDELFPDVAWDEIAPQMRQLHAKCLAAGTYLAIGQDYVKTKATECSRTAFDLACSELNDCVKMDPENQGLRQLLQKSKLIRARYTEALQQAVSK